MPARIANIGASGARRRRLGGIVWLVVGVAALVAMVGLGAPRIDRLWLVVPFTMAAAGFLQARERT